MDAKAYGDMQVQTKGEFGGLGIEVTEEDGAIKVVSPIDDTPASKAGILSGDIIIGIDDDNVQGMSLDQAVDKMRGPINSPVKLKIERKGQKNPIDFKIVRDVIKVQSVRSHVESGDIGYIRITQFTEQTADGLRNAMEKFKKETRPTSSRATFSICATIPAACSTSRSTSSTPSSTRARSSRRAAVIPMMRSVSTPVRAATSPAASRSSCLINGGSASASEIVSGALQDHKRATLIGTRSFGKGSVQTIMPLGENGALRLTTARYYTPSGRSIQAKGIEPDIELLEDVPDDLKGKDDTKGEASLKGHLKNGDDEKTGSQAYVPTDPAKDKQLDAAIDLLHGVKRADARRPTPPRRRLARAGGVAAEAKPN